MISIHGPVILDLNTQRDLFTAEGAYPVHQLEKVVEPLKRLFGWAQRLRVPVVSTRLRSLMAPGQRGAVGPTAGRLVCEPGTTGYQKLGGTSLRRRQEMALDCGTDLPVEGFRVMQQFIFDLPSLNPFECPRLDRLLSEGEAGVWLICGAPLEWTVRTAVLGLLQRRQKVAVVSDAMGQWDPYEGDMALRQIGSKNIEWLTVQQVTERFGKPAPVRHPALGAAGVVPRKARPAVGKGAAVPQRGGKVGKREFRLT